MQALHSDNQQYRSTNGYLAESSKLQGSFIGLDLGEFFTLWRDFYVDLRNLPKYLAMSYI